MTLTGLRDWFGRALATRLDERGREWYAAASKEIAGGLGDVEFAGRISLASRYSGRGQLAPSEDERAAARELVPGWDPERWSRLEALRAALVLAREDLSTPAAARALESAFQYADVGELCALYKTLPLLPDRRRFAWRAGEGCRSNMLAVFESVACDNPLPAEVFDDVAWRQMVVKAVFVGAPLWRVHGLDGRLDEELARMALDLADERRAAGRPVQHELWLCLGPHGGERALASIERELDPANANLVGRRAAACALARAGATARLEALLAREDEAEVAAGMRDALEGRTDQTAFRELAENQS